MKRIKRSNLPSKLPVTLTVLTYICYDLYNIPEWLIGVIGLLIVLFWITSIINIFKDEYIDLFSEKETKKKPKQTFQDKIKEKMKND